MTAMDTVDLHTHSSYSDGSLTPGQIVELAKKIGLRGVAVTDHDTTAGVAEATRRGEELGVEVLSGVEIGAGLDDHTMHLLGYGIRPNDPKLLSLLRLLQEARVERNRRIFARLNHLGIQVMATELPAADGQIGRPHIARLLITKGVVRTIDQAFSRFLRRGAPAYAENIRIPAAQAIEAITQAGGLAFLAHPAGNDPKLQNIEPLLRKLKALGLAGLELYYPTHTPQMHSTLERLGRDLGLLFSGGSDFHGAAKPHMPLGGRAGDRPVPFQLLAAIREGCRIETVPRH